MTQYDYNPDDDPLDKTPAVKVADAPLGRSGRGQTTLFDDVANDLALWIDDVSTKVALAFAPARAPFSAQITEDQKLTFYKSQIFNPDGSPNAAGRNQEIQRLGAESFGHVYKAVLARWPQLKPPEPPPIEVPEQWPGAPGSAPGPPGPPPMMPPMLAR